MSHRRGMIKIVTTLTLALLASGCVTPPPSTPAMPAQDAATPTHEVTADGVVILSPEESLRKDAEGYAERYGITVDEAMTRLSYQGGIGDLNATLLANEAETFGGLWIENEPEYRVVALFTRNGKRTLRPYLAGKAFAHLVEVRRARFSMAELETIYARTTRELQKLDFEVNVMLDVPGNRVEVQVSDREWFESELRRVGAQLPDGVERTVVEGGATARDKDLLLTPPVPGVAFPRQKPVEGFRECMLAALVGTLQLEDGCLYVESFFSGGDRLLPIWPPEFTLRAEGERLLVIDGKGQVAARAGEEIYMGGGGGGADEWVLQQIPPACRGDYFIVGCEVRPNLRFDSELFAVEMISGVVQPNMAPTVLFLRARPVLDEQATETISISGKLVAYDYSRCLHMQSEWGPGSLNLFWPAAWSAQLEDGTVVVLDAAGQAVARLGDEVRLRLRTIPQSMDVPVYVQLIDELPGDCVGASWVVDGVE